MNAASKKNADVNSPAKFSSSAKSVKRSLDQGGEESPNKWIASEQKEILNTGTQLAVTAAGAIRQHTTFIGTPRTASVQVQSSYYSTGLVFWCRIGLFAFS